MDSTLLSADARRSPSLEGLQGLSSTYDGLPNFDQPLFDDDVLACDDYINALDTGIETLTETKAQKDARPSTEKATGFQQGLEDPTLKNDVNSLESPVDPILDSCQFNFNFPLGAETPTQPETPNPIRYVPFSGNNIGLLEQPQTRHFFVPHPPSPYFVPQPPYGSFTAPVSPISPNQFGNITPPLGSSNLFERRFDQWGNVVMTPVRRRHVSHRSHGDAKQIRLPIRSMQTSKKRPGPAVNTGSEPSMTKKQKKASIKNFCLAREQAKAAEDAAAQITATTPTTSNHSDSSGLSSPPESPVLPTFAYPDPETIDDYIPPNFIHIPPGQSASKAQLDQIRTERLQYTKNNPQFDPFSPEPVPADLPYPAHHHQPIGFSDDHIRRTSPPKIQGRRRMHPGRKITVPQTPEVIARNAARRERYRAGLDREARAEYDRTRPGAVSVSEANRR